MSAPPPPLSPILQAALGYARSGWRIFPCRPREESFLKGGDGKQIIMKAKEPLVPRDKDKITGKPIKGTGGLAKATTDEEQIKAWWKKWPDAMIGALTGPGMDAFVVDFDVIDKKTGEVFELAERIAALEEAIGEPLPETAMAVTPSGGCHLYFGLPEIPEGMRLGNSNRKLPFKIDIRGDATGYVIVPPSQRTDEEYLGPDAVSDGRYRWEKRYSQYGVAPAPQALLDLLFVRIKGTKVAKPPAAAVDESPEALLYREACRLVIENQKASTSWLQRQLRLGYNSAARLIEQMERDGIVAAPDHVGRRDVLRQDMPAQPSAADRTRPATRTSDLSAEEEAIRKYGDVALGAECRLVREAPSGRRNDQLNESALKIASLTVSVPFAALEPSWARAMLESAARANPGQDDDHQLLATIASGWSAGEDNPRDLHEIAASARERAARPQRSSSSSRPRPSAQDDDGEPTSRGGGNGENEGGRGRGAALKADLMRTCAFMPLTDLGNLERFLERHGQDFLYVEAWGWLAWDGKRWNRDLAMALLGRAIQATMRAIQDEADHVRASGIPFPPKEGDVAYRLDDDVDDDDEPDPRGIIEQRKKERKLKSFMWYRQRDLARQTGGEGDRFDYIAQVKASGDIVLYSDKLAGWGRTSEGAGHIGCIAKMAEARLAARPEDFDADPLALNVQNGTLQFFRPDSVNAASYTIREHRREDRITKIARVTYDKSARCPQFDSFLAKVQPKEDMRAYLQRWSGYNALGLADAQKMALFYGEGSNGKGVWVQTHAWALGDYAWSTGIETFMDAGKARNAAGPSPDLAALAGRRMVYANEPEDGAKFSDGLVKSLTSDEPRGGVRELMKPPFELPITFKNTVMANHKPKIGTDFGIRRRVDLIPWMVIIPLEEQDLQLKDKLRAEGAGILNSMIAGALAYLTDGLPRPEDVVEATREYHEENDILGTFLDLCVARSKGDTVGATALHQLFAAWQTWSQQLPASGKPWSPKYLNAQMQKKGFKISKSSTMQWHDIVTRFDAFDFATGDPLRAVDSDIPAPRWPEKPSAALPDRGESAPPSPSQAPPETGGYNDDLPP